MLMKVVASTSIILFMVMSAHADFSEDVATMRAEVAEARSKYAEHLSYRSAPDTLDAAFATHGVGWAKRYAVDWGRGGLYLAWDKAKSYYDRADKTLQDWDSAVRRGRYGSDEITPLLNAGMKAFRISDRNMLAWFDEYIAEQVERGKLLDSYHAANTAGNKELAKYYLELSNHTSDDATRPTFLEMGKMVVIRPVPEESGKLTSARDWAVNHTNHLAHLAIESGSRTDLRCAITEAERVLRNYPRPQTEELATLLQILNERLCFANRPITDLLDQAEKTLSGPLREALLSEAQDRLMGRMGHLAPILAANATDQAMRGKAVSDMLDLAKRITMLRDDYKNPASLPSGLLRSINGLKSAAGLLDLANSEDPSSQQIVDVINDATGTFPAPVSPTVPFAAPAGAVAAQLDRTREAWDHASGSLEGVADAIRGDAQGLVHAEAAAQKLEDALDPRAFLKDMTDGFINGVVSNLPFARSLIDFFRET